MFDQSANVVYIYLRIVTLINIGGIWNIILSNETFFLFFFF